jgi:DNA-binding NtrC family response regulator
MLELLLVEDDPDVRATLADALRTEGYRVTEAPDGETAIRRIEGTSYDVVVSDVRLPRADGIQVFEAARAASPTTEVVLMTSFAAVDEAVAALKAGAYDYLTKPFDVDELLIRLRRIADTRQLQRDLAAARAQLAGAESRSLLVGASPSMRKLHDRIDTVAPADVPVLVQGETGTGKELVARMIHSRSPRRGRPFVAVNCAAFPEALLEAELFGHERGAFTGATKRRDGRFRAAHGGTLLLDELGEIPLSAQAKLLRVLEEGTIEPLGSNDPIAVDVRIVSATHRNLRKRISEGLFREDLYFRLHVVVLDVPPLRERHGDMSMLVEHFLRRFTASGEPSGGVTLAAWNALLRYPFPGNVRELAHAMQHAVLLARGRPIDVEHLPQDIVGASAAPSGEQAISTLGSAARAFERDYLLRTLTVTGGKRTRAAELLGISRKTLWEKLRSHGISDDDLDE